MNKKRPPTVWPSSSASRRAVASRPCSRHSSSRLSCVRSLDEASRMPSWPRTPAFPEAPSRAFSQEACRRSPSIACCGSWKPQGWTPTSGSGARPEADPGRIFFTIEGNAHEGW